MKRHMPRISAAFVLLIAINATMSCAHSAPESTAIESDQSHSSTPIGSNDPTPTPLDSRTRGWEPGHQYVYGLKLTSAVRFGTDRASFDFDLEGKLHIVPQQVATETVNLYMLITDPKITSRVTDMQPDLDKVAEQIASSGCFFALSGGRLTDISIPKGAPTMVVSVFREIASNLQVSRAQGDPKRYSAEEYDTTGRYVAQYEHSATGNVWQRRKLKYVSVLGTRTNALNIPLEIRPKIVAAESDIALSPTGRPVNISSRSELLVEGAQVPVRSTNVLLLEAESEEAAHQPDWGALMAKMDHLSASDAYGDPGTTGALDDARIHQHTFDEIMARLEPTRSKTSSANAASEERLGQEDSETFIALAAIFRRDPKTVAKALRKIRAQSPASSTLIDALGSSSSPAAQDALIELLASKTMDSKVRIRIMTALARTSNPGERAIAVLKSLLVDKPFSAQALFTLGTYSRRFRDQGKTEQAALLGDLLIERLHAAQNPSSVLTVLRAITAFATEPSS